MKMQSPVRLILLATVAAALSFAQNATISNRDIVTLAGAGFSEAFILDAIATGRTQFDTSIPALADLAKHAISERVIRAMMDQGAAAASAMPPTDAGQPVPVVMPSPNGAMVVRKGVFPRPPSTADTALQSGTPFYEWKSVLWGVWKKRVGVAPRPSPQVNVMQHLGSMYPVAPAPRMQNANAFGTPNGYTPVVYYMVAPR